MPGFLDIPAPVRHSIIAMSFWYPDNHFVELAVSREWYEQILPLLYGIYYDRWARTIDVHGELTQMLYSSSAVWPWSEEETDEWSEPDSPFPEEMEYDERDEDYCDCKDIWNDSGQPVWDSTIDYLQQAVVEWPAGSNNLYISYDHGVGVEPGSPNDYLWRSCDGQQPSGNLCEDLNGYGGMPWMNSTLVTTGEIYEFPAGSGVFHAVAPGFSNQTVGAPGTDFQSWSKDSCSCDDIWEAASNPVWDSNTVYTVGALVEYPAGTGDIWMAIVSQTTTGVTPDQPFAVL